MALAVARSISLSQTSTPPNALSGSPAIAASQADFTEDLAATPQTFVCFMIAKTASSKSPPLRETSAAGLIKAGLNSEMRLIAASTSTRLL